MLYFRKTNSLAVFSNKWMLKFSAGKCMVSKIGGKLDYKYQFQMIYFQGSTLLILWRKSTKELASLNIVLLGLPSKWWKLCIYGRVNLEIWVALLKSILQERYWLTGKCTEMLVASTLAPGQNGNDLVEVYK